MTVLSVSHVSKKFAYDLRRALWYGVCDIAGELVPGARAAALRRGEFWALDDLSFEVARGEALAIVGRNGAGKSTLLKVLWGLLKPDRGTISVRGHVGAIIELGTGFNPLLSGRENVRLVAALDGASRRQAETLLEEVLEFSELAEFIDAPVQSYSSGMKARLSYAVAAHGKPDLILVDEVLAVGDLAFQRKCVAHMRAYLARGGSLLLVSHNTHQIQSVCERGILLDRGRQVFSGTAVETLNHMFEQRLEEGAGAARRAAPAIGPVSISEVRAEPAENDVIRTGEPVRIALLCRAEERVDVQWGFSIWTADQWVCVTGETEAEPRTLEPGEHVLSCVVSRLPLVGGRYALRAGMLDVHTRQPIALYGWSDAAAVLDVRAESGGGPQAAARSNTKMTISQLVTVDVKWE